MRQDIFQRRKNKQGEGRKMSNVGEAEIMERWLILMKVLNAHYKLIHQDI
jgi:hypothetical protein